MPKKSLEIDFLYLDLNTCERCQGTDHNLEDAIQEVSAVLSAAGYEVRLNKINVTTRELAIQHEFFSSPTIRINGKDIALDVKENNCTDCGDLCGDEVDCRVWEYEGVEYNEPPKALLIDSILRAVYGGSSQGCCCSEAEDAQSCCSEKQHPPYELPDNLRKFYEGRCCSDSCC